VTAIQTCRVLLNVADIDASLAFWRDLVGFTVEQTFPAQGRPLYAGLECGEIRLMLNARGGDPAARKARPHYTEAVIYLGVASVNDLVAELRAKGFAAPDPERQDYGLDEITVRDPDGYEIAFTSPVPG
jgi:uncharacterized glyoxalase superfamily protein PhnB